MIGFVMLVGPREGDIAVDTLSHALQLYPASRACVRDDATRDGTFEALRTFAEAHENRVCLSRNATARGYFGMTPSLFAIYEHAWRAHPELDLVIKLDPDACILRPGLDELAHKKFAQFGPGMLGSYRISPAGTIRVHSMHAKSIAKDFLLIGRDSATARLRCGVPFYARYFVRALLHGYVPGHTVLRGLYILHGDTLRRLGRAGFWSAVPEHASCHTKSEDTLVSMGVKAVGHALIDINNPASGRVETWLQYAPPFPWPADTVVANKYLAIHPLKNTPEANQLRAELRRVLALELAS
jgi:hypothetical protein